MFAASIASGYFLKRLAKDVALGEGVTEGTSPPSPNF